MSTSLYSSPLIIACGDFFFRYRNGIFPLILLVLFAAFRPEAISYWAGFALALSGQAFRAVVIGFAYIRRGGVKKKVYADTLVTGGLFGVCRNPLYVGNLAIYFGLLLMHGNPLVILFGGSAFLFAYVAIVAAEERYLRNKFGADYERYCAAVPRWWPNFLAYREAVSGMSFQGARVLEKDYSTACAWIAGALVLYAYRGYHQAGPGLSPSALATGLLLVGVATLLLQRVKKSGWLKSAP